MKYILRKINYDPDIEPKEEGSTDDIPEMRDISVASFTGQPPKLFEPSAPEEQPEVKNSSRNEEETGGLES